MEASWDATGDSTWEVLRLYARLYVCTSVHTVREWFWERWIPHVCVIREEHRAQSWMYQSYGSISAERRISCRLRRPLLGWLSWFRLQSHGGEVNLLELPALQCLASSFSVFSIPAAAARGLPTGCT